MVGWLSSYNCEDCLTEVVDDELLKQIRPDETNARSIVLLVSHQTLGFTQTLFKMFHSIPSIASSLQTQLYMISDVYMSVMC